LFRSIFTLSPQIFPIDEPPCHTNLRVKLVSIKHAQDYTSQLAQADIFQLGLSMCAVATGCSFNSLNSIQDDHHRYKHQLRNILKSYDVSLMLLVDWMLEPEGPQRATINDVIRHPFFMGVNETEAFTFALNGNLFSGLFLNGEAEQEFEHGLLELKLELLSQAEDIFSRFLTVRADVDDDDADADSSHDIVHGEDAIAAAALPSAGEAAVIQQQQREVEELFARQVHRIFSERGFVGERCLSLSQFPQFCLSVGIQLPDHINRKKKGWLKELFTAFPLLFCVKHDLSGYPHVSAIRS
jgi:hypothetical protein